MDDYESLSHTKWECKYHVVFIPKCRRKTLYVGLRKHLGEVFKRLAVGRGYRRSPSLIWAAAVIHCMGNRFCGISRSRVSAGIPGLFCRTQPEGKEGIRWTVYV
ncbi:hypothetical protein SBA4_5270009 [Candidatus Sulfopaludibacter sp. SbA4]|nr:hypothetical protein SBA4_5270009 [Candidatus Sulfopaludibacter sp. SbA4]